MIKPNKYTNIDLSVVNIGGVILKSLSSCPVQKYTELEDAVVSVYGSSARVVFLNSLSFLYLIGKISYQPSADCVQLLKS